MRRRAFALAASVLVAAVALGWSGVSAADAPDRVGWWYALNQNGLAVPGPPTVPDGGLYLAQGTNDWEADEDEACSDVSPLAASRRKRGSRRRCRRRLRRVPSPV